MPKLKTRSTEDGSCGRPATEDCLAREMDTSARLVGAQQQLAPKRCRRKNANTSGRKWKLFITGHSLGLLLTLINLTLTARASHQAPASAFASMLSVGPSVPFKTSFVSSSDNPTIHRRNGALDTFQLAPSGMLPEQASEPLLMGRSNLESVLPSGSGAALDGADSTSFAASSFGDHHQQNHLHSDQREHQFHSQYHQSGAHSDDLLAISSMQMASNLTATVADMVPSNSSVATQAAAGDGLGQEGSTSRQATVPTTTTTAAAATTTTTTTSSPTTLAAATLATTTPSWPQTGADSGPVDQNKSSESNRSVAQHQGSPSSQPATNYWRQQQPSSAITSENVLTVNVTTGAIEMSAGTDATMPTGATDSPSSSTTTADPTTWTTNSAPSTNSAPAEIVRESRMVAQEASKADNASSQNDTARGSSSGAGFVMTTVPLLNGAERNGTNEAPQRVVNEFVFLPAEEAAAPLSLDQSSYPTTTSTSASAKAASDSKQNNSDSATLMAEHRTLDGDSNMGGDLELDYMNMELGPTGDGDDIPKGARQSGATATTTRKPLVAPTSASESMSKSLMSHVDLLDRIRSSERRVSSTPPATTTTTAAPTTSTKAPTTNTTATTSTSTTTTRSSVASVQSSRTPAPQQLQFQFQSTRNSALSGQQAAKPTTTTKKPRQASTPPPPLPTASTAAPTTSTSTGQPLRSTKKPKAAHQVYYSEPAAGDWRRRRKTGGQKSRAAFSPTLNGADEEEANIMTRYSVPSQLTRLSSVGSNTRVGQQSFADSTARTSIGSNSETSRRSLASGPREQRRDLPMSLDQATSSTSTVRKPSRTEPAPSKLTPIPTTTIATTKATTEHSAAPPNVNEAQEVNSVRSGVIRVALLDEPTSEQPAEANGQKQFHDELATRLAAGRPGELMMTLIASSISTTNPTRKDELQQAARSSATATIAIATTSTQATTNQRRAGAETTTDASNKENKTERSGGAHQPEQEGQLSNAAAEAAQIVSDAELASSVRRRPTALAPATSTMGNSYRAAAVPSAKQLPRSKPRAQSTTASKPPRNSGETYAAPSQFDSGQWKPDTHVDYSHEEQTPSSRLNAQGQSATSASAAPTATNSANLPGRPGVDYPIHWQVPKTSFDCRNYDQTGFYADVESDCQAYHSCHRGRGGSHTFLCPNGTLFSQELLTCDWWYNVECSASKMYMPNENHNFNLAQSN